MMVHRSTCPSPPSPALCTDGGDESPRLSTPGDDILQAGNRTSAGYSPFKPPETTFSTPLTSATASPATTLPPFRASSVTTRWNPVTGFHELLSRRESDHNSSPDDSGASDHDWVAELPGSTPASTPHQPMELEAAAPPSRRPSPSSSPTADPTRASNSRGSTPSIKQGDDATDTSPTTHENPTPAGDGGDLPSARHLRRLGSLLEAGLLVLRGSEDERGAARRRRRRLLVQRGRDGALREVGAALGARAAARHVGVAEARILRREAEAVYGMVDKGGQEGEGEEGEEMEDRERGRAMLYVMEVVQEIAARAEAAAAAVEEAALHGAEGAVDADDARASVYSAAGDVALVDLEGALSPSSVAEAEGEHEDGNFPFRRKAVVVDFR